MLTIKWITCQVPDRAAFGHGQRAWSAPIHNRV